jgi:excisionase family DNA binding protein
MPNTFTVKDVAQRFAVSVRTVLTWVHAGELRALQLGRRQGAKRPSWRITEAALQAFEATRTATPSLPQKRRRRRANDVISFY